MLLVLAACLIWPRHGMAGGEVCVVQIPEHLLERPFAGPGVDVLKTTYAFTNGKAVPVYARPAGAEQGEMPVRFLPEGYIGLSLERPEPVMAKGEPWYQINQGEYVRAVELALAEPSRHQGVLVPHFFDKTFAWVLFNSRVSKGPGEAPEEDALFLPERALVFVHELREVDGEKWCDIGCGWWLPYRRLGLVIRQPRPPGVGEREQWIDVSLNEQTLAAYEGDRLVFATLISGGESNFPTVEGLFQIYFKAAKRKMSGGEDVGAYYYLEDVPWQMYFHEGFALHASYWHDFLGLPNSHGCVNLSPKDAKWIFEWSIPRFKAGQSQAGTTRKNPGSWVWIHE